jgi:LysM repeat protein
MTSRIVTTAAYPRASLTEEEIPACALAPSRGHSYFRAMKSFAQFLALALLLALAFPALTQDNEAAAAAAARQDAEERYKRLNAAVEDLITAQAAQQKKISELAAALAALREEMTRHANNNTTRDELRSLAEKVREIEKNREADKQLIVDELKKLAKASAARPVTVNAPVTERPEKGYEYVVQAGDTLSSIVAAYRKEGIKVTTDMVLKANPKLDPNKMQIGQKIFIPQP